jgi:hypothetical protein
MRAIVVFELTLAFVVSCADRAGEDEERPHRPMLARVVRGVFWMVTLTRWLTYRNLTTLSRFAAIVWLLVTSGWLITMIHDRAPSTAVFLAGSEGVMAFVVYCTDALSADFRAHWFRRANRSLFWPKALTDYMRDRDSIKIIQASLTVWILLTTGWLLALEADRVARPLWSPAR